MLCRFVKLAYADLWKQYCLGGEWVRIGLSDITGGTLNNDPFTLQVPNILPGSSLSYGNSPSVKLIDK